MNLMRVVALIVIAVSMVAASSKVIAASWWSIDETRAFQGTGDSLVRVSVLTIDLAKANLRILSVPFELGTSPRSTELSVNGFALKLSRDKKYQGKEWILVNGGFSSYRVDVPLGLLVVDGKVYSTLSKEESKRPIPSTTSEYSQYRWSGVLCQGRVIRTWDIIPVARYTPGSCHQALQAGPVPVEPISKVAISSSEPKSEPRYVRTAICIVDESTMKIAITQNETHLLPMALWMSKPVAGGGLGCRVALNLSGDNSAGVAINSVGSKSPKLLGVGTFPLPTVLLFEAQ